MGAISKTFKPYPASKYPTKGGKNKRVASKPIKYAHPKKITSLIIDFILS
jgi:hypothetical protein